MKAVILPLRLWYSFRPLFHSNQVSDPVRSLQYGKKERKSLFAWGWMKKRNLPTARQCFAVESRNLHKCEAILYLSFVSIPSWTVLGDDFIRVYRKAFGLDLKWMPFPKNTMKLLALFKLLTANGDAASVILSPLSTSTGGMNTSLFCTAKVGSTHQLEVFAWCSNSGGVFYDFCLNKRAMAL